MFSTLRTRFGIPGVISVIALVFAMFGGAYAASSGSSGGKATASAKAKKGPRGPKGATGPAGPAGPAGAKGDAGANGAAGGVGSAGPTGATGLQGNKGATGVTGPIGATGATGFSGFTATLPSGQTETGTWEYNESSVTNFSPLVMDAISFPIPLATAGKNKAFVFSKEETELEQFGSSGCSGTLEEPTAPKGVLCVYTGAEAFENASVSLEARMPPMESGERGYGVSGSFVRGVNLEGGIFLKEGEVALLREATAQFEGTWAVTAP
ncbi:MAG: hypothetical protein QOF13_1901 [Solirubrobacterales bacterium]|jgi:hypothetical protein|nr:hypothetical protein [Solirubrobacterales bacterium]